MAGEGPARSQPSDDPRQLAAQFDLVQRELERSERRLASLEQALMETQQAHAACTALAEAGKPTDTFIALGGGVHAHARIDGKAPVLMPIGAGYFTESPAANVAAALEERSKSLAQSFQQASAEAERLAQVAATINDRLSSLSNQ